MVTNRHVFFFNECKVIIGALISCEYDRRRYVINIDTNKTEGAFRFIGINVNHIPTSRFEIDIKKKTFQHLNVSNNK